MHISVLVTGRSYHLAQAVPPMIELAAGSDLRAALTALAGKMSPEHPLPAECLLAVNGRHLGTLAAHSNPTLADGDELVLIAPVSGG